MRLKTIEEAQKTLDNRNGKVDLLNYNGMRNKCDIRCRICGNTFSASPDNLLRNKSDLHFGCIKCAENDSNNKLLLNNLKFVKKLNTGKLVVKCMECGAEFEGWRANLTNKKFSCKFCDKDLIHKKRLLHTELYGEKTIYKETLKENFLSIIRNNSLEWYYILGLLLSDGSFNVKKNRVRLRLQSGDFDTVVAVANKLGCQYKVNQTECSLDFCTDALEYIVKKYKISNNKTCEPCDITSINGENMIAFVIGFIDGDGSIGYRSDSGSPRIAIKLHQSWRENLQYMTEQVYDYFHVNKHPNSSLVKHDNKQYATVTWGNKTVIDGLASFIIKNNIPAMKRKWRKIILEWRGDGI